MQSGHWTIDLSLSTFGSGFSITGSTGFSSTTSTTGSATTDSLTIGSTGSLVIFTLALALDGLGFALGLISSLTSSFTISSFTISSLTSSFTISSLLTISIIWFLVS